MALQHKELQAEYVPVRIADKAAIAFSGQECVPILQHGEKVVAESMTIALHLEEKFPDSPSLFNGAQSRARFFNLWVDRDIMQGLVPYFALELLGCVERRDAEYLRSRFEAAFNQRLEDLAAERQAALAALRKRLAPARKMLRAGDFLTGDQPAYIDYVLFSPFQWARLVSLTPVFEIDDPLNSWFERMLDLYIGFARAHRSRQDRDDWGNA